MPNNDKNFTNMCSLPVPLARPQAAGDEAEVQHTIKPAGNQAGAARQNACCSSISGSWLSTYGGE